MSQFTKRAKLSPPPKFTKTLFSTATYEGGAGFTKDTKTELYTLVMTERFSNTFYEAADERFNRLAKLAVACAVNEPVWFSRMIPWLRSEANLRSVGLVMAAIYCEAWSGDRALSLPAAALKPAEVVAAVCQRADEPTELLAVFMTLFGKSFPKNLRKGLTRAMQKNWNEYSVLKYNRSGFVGMRDALNLIHPGATSPEQGDLFRYIINSAYGSEYDVSRLPMIAARQALMEIPESDRRDYMKAHPEALKAAGVTWEWLSSWIPGGYDAEAWEAAIPSMGYMALIRNIRNFEDKNVSRLVQEGVRTKLADPSEVAKSRLLPYRFYSAIKATDSDFYRSALSDAFHHSIRNVPELDGPVLVMVDGSGSMGGGFRTLSGDIPPIEKAAVMAAIANAKWDCDVWLYDTQSYPVKFTNRNSALSNVDQIVDRSPGGGTQTWPMTQQALITGEANGRKYDTILVITDMQDAPGGQLPNFAGDIFVFDALGYRAANMKTQKGRYLITGFDDSAFKIVGQIKDGQRGFYPWMQD